MPRTWSDKARAASVAARSAPIEVRFWRHVEKTDGCWFWTGAKTKNGYGVIARGSRDEGNVLAHDLSYEMHFGPIPPGKKVLHRCDVRLCVKPDDLFVGTDQDNSDDMVAKGRSLKGERQPVAQLTASDVRYIRSLTFPGRGGSPKARQNTVTFADIAAQYGVSEATVRDAYHRRTWKHIE